MIRTQTEANSTESRSALLVFVSSLEKAELFPETIIPRPGAIEVSTAPACNQCRSNEEKCPNPIHFTDLRAREE